MMTVLLRWNISQEINDKGSYTSCTRGERLETRHIFQFTLFVCLWKSIKTNVCLKGLYNLFINIGVSVHHNISEVYIHPQQLRHSDSDTVLHLMTYKQISNPARKCLLLFVSLCISLCTMAWYSDVIKLHRRKGKSDIVLNTSMTQNRWPIKTQERRYK